MIIVNSNEEEKDFQKLYHKYYKKIFNYIYRSVLDMESAEDLIQNVFMNAFRHIKNNNPYIDNFNGWIYRIALNEILKFKNKNNKINIIESNDDNSDLLDNALDENDDNNEKMIDFSIVSNAMLELKPKEKQVIHLYFFEKLKHSEISEIMDMKENTLRPLLSRSLEKLRKIVENRDKNLKINKNICTGLLILFILY